MRIVVPALIAIGASLAIACGARSELAASGSSTGNGGSGGPACAPLGATCAGTHDCCDALCTSGVCAPPPPACLEDTGPVVLVTGLADPYALGGDATSLFAGQLEKDLPLLRIPKAGGPAATVVDHLSFVENLTVREGTVFYTDEHTLSSVPTMGGAPTKLVSGFGPTGFALAPKRVYLADYLAKELLAIDPASLASEVLQTGQDGIYRVAATEDAAYFSTFSDGLRRHRISDGALDTIAPDLGEPRAVLAVEGSVYYTVPKTQRVYRLASGADAPELMGDLSSLGTFPEVLQTDGAFLYLTLVTGQGDGLVVRIPLGGGEAEVVTSAGGPQPSALVVDEACVYWTERSTGSVLRARKP